MKPSLILFVLLLCTGLTARAQGLITNNNQSTMFVRMPSRNASQEIDAAFYNPAGLTSLESGFHLGVFYQGILRKNSVISGYPLLNEAEYSGNIRSLLVPSAFLAYKDNKLAVSLQYGTFAGPGTVKFERGLPTYEIPVSRLVPDLMVLNDYGYDVSAYKLEASFTGKIGYQGIQAGVAFELFKGFSVSGGINFLFGAATFNQNVRDVQLEVNDTWEDAPEKLNSIGDYLISYSSSYSSLANKVQTIITAGAGNYTIAQVQTAGYITSAERAAWEGALSNLGLSSAQIAALKLLNVKPYFTNEASTSNLLGIIVNSQASSLEDEDYITEQPGSGWRPYLAIQYSPLDNLNIALKYEHKTRIDINDETEIDAPLLVSEIPGVLSVGVGYKPFSWLETQLSYNHYFDRGIDWGFNIREIVAHYRETVRTIDRNSFDLGLGFQFKINEKFAVSTGALYFQPGENPSYQYDYSYINPSVTAGLGARYKINDKLSLDAGIMNSFFKKRTVTYQDAKLQSYFSKYPSVYPEPEFENGEYSEELGGSRLVFSVGLSYSLGL